MNAFQNETKRKVQPNSRRNFFAKLLNNEENVLLSNFDVLLHLHNK